MTDRDSLVARRLSAAVHDVDIDVEERLSELFIPGRSPHPGKRAGHRLLATVVALGIAGAGLILAGRSFLPSSSRAGSGGLGRAILFDRYSASPRGLATARMRLWSVSEDGTSARPLPQPAGSNQGAALSPDGSSIAFAGTVAPGRPGQLWVMDPDGSGLVRLADGFGADQPAWSPDGRSIAFVGMRDPEGSPPGRPGIWVVARSGGHPRLVLTGRGWEHPAWSPDGTRLVVAGDWNLFTVGVDGSGLTRITHDGANYAAPAWSPDGRTIACARWTGGNPWNLDVYLIHADGSGLRQLTRWKGWDSGPVWSGDGSRILFTSDRGATPEQLAHDRRARAGELGLGIYVTDAGGTGARRVFVDHAVNAVPTSWGR